MEFDPIAKAKRELALIRGYLNRVAAYPMINRKCDELGKLRKFTIKINKAFEKLNKSEPVSEDAYAKCKKVHKYGYKIVKHVHRLAPYLVNTKEKDAAKKRYKEVPLCDPIKSQNTFSYF